MRHVINPLRELKSMATQNTNGGLDASFILNRIDEVGVLGQELERMRVNINNILI